MPIYPSVEEYKKDAYATFRDAISSIWAKRPALLGSNRVSPNNVSAVSGRLGDGAANRGERRGIVKIDGFALTLNAQFLPELIEVRRNGISFHPVVDLLQDRYSDRLVGNLQCARQRPLYLNASSRFQDPAHRILETHPVARALPDFDVGEQTVHSPAPIGPSPGVRKIESAISGLW